MTGNGDVPARAQLQVPALQPGVGLRKDTITQIVHSDQRPSWTKQWQHMGWHEEEIRGGLYHLPGETHVGPQPWEVQCA